MFFVNDGIKIDRPLAKRMVPYDKLLQTISGENLFNTILGEIKLYFYCGRLRSRIWSAPAHCYASPPRFTLSRSSFTGLGKAKPLVFWSKSLLLLLPFNIGGVFYWTALDLLHHPPHHPVLDFAGCSARPSTSSSWWVRRSPTSTRSSRSSTTFR